jgi:hypothetical protein
MFIKMNFESLQRRGVQTCKELVRFDMKPVLAAQNQYRGVRTRE